MHLAGKTDQSVMALIKQAGLIWCIFQDSNNKDESRSLGILTFSNFYTSFFINKSNCLHELLLLLSDTQIHNHNLIAFWFKNLCLSILQSPCQKCTYVFL